MNTSLVEKIKNLLEENGVDSSGIIVLIIPATGSSNLEHLKRTSIPKTVKTQLWKHYFNNEGKGKCYCCGEEILPLGSWEAGHVIAHKHGGSDEIDNLRPVCSTCNKSMGTMNMDRFKQRYFIVNKNILGTAFQMPEELKAINIKKTESDTVLTFLIENLEYTGDLQNCIIVRDIFNAFKYSEPEQMITSRKFVPQVRNFAKNKDLLKPVHGALRLYGYRMKKIS